MSNFFDEIARLSTLTGSATPKDSLEQLNEFDVRDIQAVRVSEGGGGGGGNVTSPLQIDGCALWLDASQLVLANDAPVATWTDLSGNGYSPVQATGDNQPTCQTAVQNGLRVVRFNDVPNPQYLDFTGGALGLFRNLEGVTLAMVIGTIVDDHFFGASEGADATAARVTCTALSFDSVPDDSSSGTSLSLNPTGGNLDVGFASLLYAVDFVNGLGDYVSSPGSPAIAPTPAPVGTSADTDSLRIRIGGSLADTPNGANLDCGEFIIYQRVLNARERRELLEYLSVKWAS